MAAQFRGKTTAGQSLWICEELRTLLLYRIAFASFVCVCVCVCVCVWPESCSAVGKLNLKTRLLNPPRSCVCVCLCSNAQYSMHSCTLPHIHLLHSSSSCSHAPTALFVTLESDGRFSPKSALSEKNEKKNSSRLGHYAVETAVQHRLGGGDG